MNYLFLIEFFCVGFQSSKAKSAPAPPAPCKTSDDNDDDDDNESVGDMEEYMQQVVVEDEVIISVFE